MRPPGAHCLRNTQAWWSLEATLIKRRSLWLLRVMHLQKIYDWLMEKGMFLPCWSHILETNRSGMLRFRIYHACLHLVWQSIVKKSWEINVSTFNTSIAAAYRYIHKLMSLYQISSYNISSYKGIHWLVWAAGTYCSTLQDTPRSEEISRDQQASSPGIKITSYIVTISEKYYGKSGTSRLFQQTLNGSQTAYVSIQLGNS